MIQLVPIITARLTVVPLIVVYLTVNEETGGEDEINIEPIFLIGGNFKGTPTYRQLPLRVLIICGCTAGGQ